MQIIAFVSSRHAMSFRLQAIQPSQPHMHLLKDILVRLERR